MNEATFTRALDIVLHEHLIRHEAGHAAAALLLGLKVTSVRAGFHTHSELRDANPEDAAGETRFEATNNDHRQMAIAILAGPMAEGKTAYWPPRWPLSLAPLTPDERQVGDHVQALDLDQAGYDELCDEARALTETPVFKRLHRYLVQSLTEPPHTIGAAEAAHLKTIAERASMEHLELKATTTVSTDAGTFEAVISTATIDREQDIVEPAAMVDALHAWTTTGKQIPLAWSHSTAPEDIIGHVDPSSAHEVNGEVVVDGWIDQTTDRGSEAWRLVSPALASASATSSPSHPPARRSGRHASPGRGSERAPTPVPANNDTRVLAWKALDSDL